MNNHLCSKPFKKEQEGMLIFPVTYSNYHRMKLVNLKLHKKVSYKSLSTPSF